MTPEQLKADDIAQEKKRAAAEREQEKQRQIEAAAKARRDAEVKAETDRLGAHRQAEIRRKLELRDKAMAARPKEPTKQCRIERNTRNSSWQGKTNGDALLSAQRGVRSLCGSGEMLGSTAPVCSPDPVNELPKPPVGDCLACISEKQATSLGWVKGVGWPKREPTWTCKASATCKVEKCDAVGSSAGSRQ